MKHKIVLHKQAAKEILSFPKTVQIKLRAVMQVLEELGKIEPPTGKKIGRDLFEIRIKVGNQYRFIYAYFTKQTIIILNAFIKKQQKTPKKEIDVSIKRMKECQL